MAEMETSLIVAAPLREVYNQWTQFEDFPRSRRVNADLEHFKEFIEDRERATGAWRGEIHGQIVETPRV